MNTIETTQWAEEIFGKCNLGDPRRVTRLVNYAAKQAAAPGASTFGSCEGDMAASEGAYRFLRNDNVEPKDIDNGVARATVAQCLRKNVVLAIQDTTGVEVAHVPLRAQLKDEGCPTGFLVHSSLMVDGETGVPIGLINQMRWIREKERAGKETRRQRNYEEKESYRWEVASRRMVALMGDASNVITLADREADIFEFLHYHQENRLRYVVRVSHERILASGETLWSHLEKMPMLGYRQIEIGQRGPWRPAFEKNERPGRKARVATLEIRAGQMTLPQPKRSKSSSPVIVNVVYIKEIDVPEGSEPLEWRLFTSEPIDAFESVSLIIKYYGLRWLIEEFHKSWKVGCRLEERVLQSLDAVERFMAISGPIAIRLLQLQLAAYESPDGLCANLSEDELQCLSAMPIGGKPPKKGPMSNRDIYYAIAKLGGWMDTKRNGRVGWQSIWKGWARFQDRFEGWRLAKKAFQCAQTDL